MNEQEFLMNRQTWVRFTQRIKDLAASEVGSQAKWLFALLIALLLGVNGLNVINSYVGRDFMTAVAERNQAGFILQALIYIGVFAVSTLVAVYYRFTEERLGLLWREWFTRRLVKAYLDNRTYYYLKEKGEILNPDERIADDVRTFTATTLSFVLMLSNGLITVLAFSGVMWSISPWLFAVTVIYSVCGTLLAVKLGRSLISLNYTQIDKEANLRTGLIYVSENAESIVLSRREGRLGARLSFRIKEFADNFRRIIAVNRNLGFFTTGYNYLIQVIPVLVIAPLYFRGEVEFGVITQSAMAFAYLVGAFSLIVTQFQSISSYTAVMARIDSLEQTIEQERSPRASAIEVSEGHEGIAYERLTLLSPDDGRPLLKDLSIKVPHGTRLLVSGPNETAKLALFRATAGLWEAGEGRILRPRFDSIRFLPERPYLYPGTLRELLLRSGEEHAIADEQILGVLHELKLDPVLARAGGLDMEQNWESVLSLGEEQLLAFTRLLLAAPKFVFLDRVCTALSAEQVQQILILLCVHSITYIALEEAENLLELYDAVLEIADDGSWELKQVQAGKVIAPAAQKDF